MVNYLVHRDGYGIGLVGLDPRGELESFSRWSGFRAIDEKNVRRAIPPALQMEYLALRLSELRTLYRGDIWRALAAWHTGGNPDNDYVGKVRAHIAALQGLPKGAPISSLQS
jgi:hypothetical protein